MNKKRAQLAIRRRQLVAQVADQRTMLALNMEPWRARLSIVDRGVALLRYVGRTPVLIGGGALFFLVFRRGRMGKWLRHGLMVWQIARRLRHK